MNFAVTLRAKAAVEIASGPVLTVPYTPTSVKFSIAVVAEYGSVWDAGDPGWCWSFVPDFGTAVVSFGGVRTPETALAVFELAGCTAPNLPFSERVLTCSLRRSARFCWAWVWISASHWQFLVLVVGIGA